MFLPLHINIFINKIKYMPARPHYSYERTPEHIKDSPNTHNPLINTLPNESPSFRPYHNPALTSKNTNAPFVSIYGRETRLEQVMRLKARPVTASKDGIQALLREDKSEVMVREEPSRLQKIMALKVPKPTVASTLINYHPRVVPRYKQIELEKQGQKDKDKEKDNTTPDERLWMCQQKCRREAEAQERAERQWRQQERQREMDLKRKRKQAEQEEAKQRRKETQFQKLVQKEVRRIQRERQLSQRKNGGFAVYIYPEC